MASFSDILKGVNARLNYNADDPDRVDNKVDWKLAFNAKPKSHINLNAEKKVER